MAAVRETEQRQKRLHEDVERVLIDETSLQARIIEMGQEITTEYADRDLLLVAVLKGSVLFLADLMRRIAIPHEIDFMATSSYGAWQAAALCGFSKT